MGTTKKLPKGISIKKHASGNESILLSFTYRGKRYRETLRIIPNKQNIKFAEQHLASVQLAIARGDFDHAVFFPNSKHANNDNRTLNELVEQRFNQLEQSGARERSTLVKRRELYQLHLSELGRRNPADIRAVDFERTIRSGELGRIRASQLISIVRPIFSSLWVEGSIRSNPCEHINWSDLYPRRLPRRNESIDPFSESEIRSILTHSEHADLFTFALFTGLRLQELPLVTFDNIRGNTIEVCAAIGLGENDEEYIKAPKTGNGRTIDLLPPAKAVVERRLASVKSLSGSNYIFIDHSTKSRYRLNSIRWYWKRACRDAGVRYRPVKQTRHTFASLMLSRGENPMWVAQQLGHSDLKMLRDHYGRWIPEEGGYVPKNDWNITGLSLDSEDTK